MLGILKEHGGRSRGAGGLMSKKECTPGGWARGSRALPPLEAAWHLLKPQWEAIRERPTQPPPLIISLMTGLLCASFKHSVCHRKAVRAFHG